MRRFNFIGVYYLAEKHYSSIESAMGGSIREDSGRVLVAKGRLLSSLYTIFRRAKVAQEHEILYV